MLKLAKQIEKWEVKKLEEEISECHEGATIKIKHNVQGKFYSLIIDGTPEGEIYECTECAYKYDSIAGNWVEDLTNCCECGKKTWEA